MKYPVAAVLLCILLISSATVGQTNRQTVKRSSSQSGPTRNTSPSGLIRICQGVDIPEGYVIVAYQTSSACPHGAYVLKKDSGQSRVAAAPAVNTPPNNPASPSLNKESRPRRVTAQGNPVVPVSNENVSASNSREPTLSGVQKTAANARPPMLSGPPGGTAVSLGQPPPSETATDASAKNGPSSDTDEVGEGDVVRIETNLVTVPVSVLDRQGRFVPNLRREDFKVFENGVEQPIAYFEPTEKPFTVALVLDTSASTHFHLSQIKEAAIAFAKQLRPQDRVLVVTFSDEVLLLAEVTNDLKLISAVIEENAQSGDSTRLYDAIDLVINERLNKIQGRKAIVLFTDGVDTSSYLATYQSTLRQVEELDALIYPIQYDTLDFLRTMQSNATVVTTTTSNWPFPARTTSRVIYGPPTPGLQLPNSIWADYERGDQYLHQLADKTGARLYQANDPAQLANAFSRIAEELRRQYSLGYYPQTSVQAGERRLIKVRVNQPDLAVRARDSYMQRGLPRGTQ